MLTGRFYTAWKGCLTACFLPISCPCHACSLHLLCDFFFNVTFNVDESEYSRMILSKTVQPPFLLFAPLPFKVYAPVLSSHDFNRAHLPLLPPAQLTNFPHSELT